MDEPNKDQRERLDQIMRQMQDAFGAVEPAFKQAATGIGRAFATIGAARMGKTVTAELEIMRRMEHRFDDDTRFFAIEVGKRIATETTKDGEYAYSAAYAMAEALELDLQSGMRKALPDVADTTIENDQFGNVVIMVGDRSYATVSAEFWRALSDDACKSITLQTNALHGMQEAAGDLITAIADLRKVVHEAALDDGLGYLRHDPTKHHRRRKERKQRYTVARKGFR